MGACDFVVKPFTVKSLQDKIERYINKDSQQPMDLDKEFEAFR
jgi:FixJ family two-component response regulator